MSRVSNGVGSRGPLKGPGGVQRAAPPDAPGFKPIWYAQKGSPLMIFFQKKKWLMALPKLENQPYAIIFWVHTKQKKLSICMENNLEIACVVHSMMNDTPSTRKSTLCCNISITQRTKGLFVCIENNFEILVCVLLWKTLPVPVNQPYAIIFWLHNKNICFTWKNVYTWAGRALAQGVHWGQGGGPWRGLQGGNVPKKILFLVS